MELHCLCLGQHKVFQEKRPLLPLSNSPPRTEKKTSIFGFRDSHFECNWLTFHLNLYLHSLLVSPHPAKCLSKQSAVRANKICQHMMCGLAQGCDKNWFWALKIQAVLFCLSIKQVLIICPKVGWLLPDPWHVKHSYDTPHMASFTTVSCILSRYFTWKCSASWATWLGSIHQVSWARALGIPCWLFLCYGTHCTCLLGILAPKPLPHLSLPPLFLLPMTWFRPSLRLAWITPVICKLASFCFNSPSSLLLLE